MRWVRVLGHARRGKKVPARLNELSSVQADTVLWSVGHRAAIRRENTNIPKFYSSTVYLTERSAISYSGRAEIFMGKVIKC